MIFSKQIIQMNLKQFCILTGILFLNFTLTAQSIRINEVVSSNSSHLDEDGDTPDWIELHNFGVTPVSLLNWGLTDNVEKLHDWQFPDLTLNPDEYLLVWASDKNRTELSFAKTLVNQGDTHNYLVPGTEPDSNWKNLTFDDSTWNSGRSGFGYGDDDDATEIEKDSTALYTRIKFTMANLANLNSLILDVDYDDGFVAYLNGVEIARENIDGLPPSYDTYANKVEEANIYRGRSPERFIIDDAKSLLVNGDNILAFQLHNVSATSSDLTLIPFLSAIFSTNTTIGITPPEILSLYDSKFHTNFKISSKSDELFLSDANQNIIDQVLVENLPSNTSLGVSKTSNTLVNFIDTTPGFENSDIEYLGVVKSTLEFSNEGGALDAPINLALSGNSAGETIRYTLDSSSPTEDDLAYTTPIVIDSNTVVRARIFAPNYIPTATASRSFVFNTDHEMDIMLITVDSEDFFNEDTGMYTKGTEGTYDEDFPYFGANFWEDRELPAHFSFLEKGSNEVAAQYNAGVKIFGGWSRGHDQRSLSFFARSAYGDSEFEHPFFDELNYDKFQSFVLRNSGNDWLKTSIKDIALTSLMRGADLEFQEYNPVATYINGEYWGLYRMREKNNEHMLASKHNIDADDITILEKNAKVNEGSNEEYKALIDYVSNTDLSNDANFKYVADRVDIINYALYQASNIYFNNTDWPGNNIRFWKAPNTKWRWMLYDTDFGFGPFWDTENYDFDTLEYALEDKQTGSANPTWSTLLFRSLNTNIGFRNIFINRYADELNTRFLPEHVKTHIDNTALTVASELERHHDRWGGSVDEANYFINKMKDFAESRPDFAKEHILSQYDLPAIHAITIENKDISQGYVRVNNNLKIQDSTWTGDYFETVPIELTAIAEFGYMFTHWSGDIDSTDSTINISLVEANTVIPNFEETVTETIVINEINYKSGEILDSDDWVELYNPNNFAVDISNWQLKDNDDANVFTIPEGTLIEAEAFIVLVKKTGDFTSVFPNITNFIGDLGFGLSSNTDAVRLFNANAVLHDEVNYTSTAPWVDCPAGTGQTLELISPELDNSLAESWNCISTNGTPDAPNLSNLSIEENDKARIKIFPNPVGSTLYFKGAPKLVSVQITNLAGQQIMILENPTDKINVDALQKGFYLIKIQSENRESIHKLIKN